MKKLHLAKNLSLPLDAVTQSIAILAKRRAGKSYTARRFTEQLIHREQQTVIVDPKGDWWGIRSGADGKSPGLEVVILGGEHGDLPLEVHSGEIIAKLVVHETVNVLLDLSLFRKGEVATFMSSFLENFYRLKAREEHRSPVMLVVDEADAIAPQKPFKGEERMLGAIEDIVRRGGQRGIGCLLISQRSAVLNKNVLTQTQVLAAMRTIAPQDLAAMDAWVDVHGTQEQRRLLMESLPSLPIGDVWFWSPGWPTAAGIFERVHILPIETFDSGATPKPGEKRIQPKHLADVDLDALRRQMAETIEKAKADDPRELRKQIADLRRQLAAKTPAASTKTSVAAKPDRATLDAEFARGAAAERKKLLADFEKRFVRFNAKFNRIVQALGDASLDELRELLHVPKDSPAAAPAPIVMPRPPAARAVRPAKPVDPDARVSGPQQRILDGMAWLETIGVRQAKRQIAAFLGEASPNSSAFMNNLGVLRTAGFIDYPGQGLVALTEGGRAIANHPDSPPTSQELHQLIYAKLPGPQSKILGVLIGKYPDALSREDLASEAGASHTSSAYMNNLGSLRSLGLIDYPTRGEVAALPLLFLEDR